MFMKCVGNSKVFIKLRLTFEYSIEISVKYLDGDAYAIYPY